MASGDGRILLSTPDVGDLEQEYVMRAMKSGWVAPAGPDLEAFEQEVADRVGARFAVGLASGTAALHLALVSWGVGSGDVVPVATLTFAATINAIRYVGAEPYFVDCDESGNISPDLLEQALIELHRDGRDVPVVLPVDLLGKCVDHVAIRSLVEPFGCRILADSAESFGSSRDGVAAGSFGDASVLSFNGNKIMTTSGGGMLLTDDVALADHVRKLSTQAREPVAHYEHTEVGFNYRLSNILAALGRAQLTRLDTMIDRRRGWRERYRALVSDQPGVSVLGGAQDEHDNCWLTALVVDPEQSAWTAGDLAHALSAAGVETRPVWKPMHMQPVSKGYEGLIDGTAERLFLQGLTLPSGSALSPAQFKLIEETMRAVVTLS